MQSFRVSIGSSINQLIINLLLLAVILCIYMAAELLIFIKIFLVFSLIISAYLYVTTEVVRSSNKSIILMQYLCDYYLIHFNSGKSIKIEEVKTIYVSRFLMVLSFKSHTKKLVSTIFYDAVSSSDYRRLLLHFSSVSSLS